MTAHAKAPTTDEINEMLCTRNDQLEAEKAALAEQLERAEMRAETLAAHVERQASIIFQALAAIEDGDFDAAPWDEARAAYNDGPTTSFALLKAEWQADVLHKLLMHPREATLRKMACEMRDELRRQVERGE